MSAKRALNFNTPAAKRRRQSYAQDTRHPMVLYRAIKPEMKFKTLNVTHAATTGSNLAIPQIAQGTGQGERIGNRVKLYYIEMVLRDTSAGNAFRMDLLGINDSTSAPAHTFSGFPDRNLFSELKSEFHHVGTGKSSLGSFTKYRFPLGHICKFTDGTSSTCNSGELVMRLTCLAGLTIVGEVRIWYTDV